MNRSVPPGNRSGNASAGGQAAGRLLGRQVTVGAGLERRSRVGRARADPRAVKAYVDLVGDLSGAPSPALFPVLGPALFEAAFRLLAVARTAGEGERVGHANGVRRQVLELRR